MWFSLALDKSTDVQDTAQLLVFIRVINTRFELPEELQSVEPLKDTTTDQDLFNGVENCVERTGLVWNKMASVNNRWSVCFNWKKEVVVKLMNNKMK